MNTSAVAQNLASYGRNGDTTLVHMTPGEVGGLQKLAMAHGGSLTINPETGLPEANFLKSLLPTIAGAGLMMIPGVGPIGAGLIVGGFEAARTGDIGQGIMSGLSAYGGAGLGQSLSTMGGNVAGEGVRTAAQKQMLEEGAKQTLQDEVLKKSTTGIAMGGVGQGASSIAGAATPAATYGSMAEGAKQLIQPGGLTSLRANMVGNLGKTGANLATAGGALGIANAAGVFEQPEYALVKPEKPNYAGPYFPTERTASFRGRDAILGGEGREFQYFDDVNPFPNVRTATAAHGGLMSTKMAQGGRYLDGPGDGVSDSIPATVDGEQPVLLSEGEYIIPAEVVSAVGNGSSDAGAGKFTALVDTIMAKTRKIAKGEPNGADKLLKGLIPQTA